MAFAALHSPQEWRHRFGADKRPAAVAVGNFDGVHLGHREILDRVSQDAVQSNGRSVAITFDPHPLRVLRPAQAPPLLMTLPQRLAAIEAEGIDAALVLEFNATLQHMSPEDFVREILIETLNSRSVVVGENFRFGYGHAGDVDLLIELSMEHDFSVKCIPPVVRRGTTVSSTAIRNAVREGAVVRAGRMLGRPFTLGGEIQPGHGQGRRVLVPTLNLRTEQELLPKNGVYATEVVVGGQLHRAVTNIGVRPTFGGGDISVESFIFDFNSDITAGPMEVRFWRRLRDEMKFPGPEELRRQIQRDERRARQFFRLLDKFSLKKQSA
ncbi:MAG TPA: bifunctional riboflavin kinase/FAD synthetase [Candidatus Acidoferrales bacterium]|nr:bifunctional riboflavin kinase/FAD synthetase [Candidatus Acidoferrales bacterium]